MVVTTSLSARAGLNCPISLTGSNFEIDANANLKPDSADAACIDWRERSTNTLRSSVTATADKPSGSGDDSFGKGTSEDDANPTIVDGSIPPNKSDLKTFGVSTETTASGKFLQLFWSRVQNPSGTTNMDFELNQKSCNLSATPTNCANNGSQFPAETPIRTPGDKLITYDLSKGGTVPTISIRTWSGSAWGTATLLSTSGLAIGSVNTTDILSTDSPIGALAPYTFGEASVSFSAIFPSTTGTCGTFGSAYLKSRSSDSFNSELKDFIAPEKVQITNCTTLATTATNATIGGTISDSAIVSGATADAGGSITFKLYSDAACTNLVTTLGPIAVNGNGPYSSGPYSPTTVGSFYWIAAYTGDANNAGSAGKCGDDGETSVVSKAQPAISTVATASVTVGTTISDLATLSGGVNLTGQITFKVYSDANCATEVAAGLTPVTVNGAGTYGSGPFTPAVGTYRWIATYSGDARNLPAAGACNDAGETSTVRKAQPSIATVAVTGVTIGSSISDAATLSGATSTAGGAITFRLYSDATCQTQVVTGLTPVPVSGNNTYQSGPYTPSTVGSFYWIASYSGDASNEPATGACQDTGETSTVGKAASNISTAQTVYPQDSTTLTATAGGTPTGNVTFNLYGPNDANCSVTAAYTQVVTLDGAGFAKTTNTTFAVTAANAGLYRWVVIYAGDSTHNGSTSPCGVEQSSLLLNDNAAAGS